MIKNILVAAIVCCCITHAQAQTYTRSPQNEAARAWFTDAKFGLFIHWGPFSIPGDGEWVMNNQQMPVATYEKLPAFFNPTAFDPAEWVQMVKDAGMKYITITSNRDVFHSRILHHLHPFGGVKGCWIKERR